jgi:hypothetical protein
MLVIFQASSRVGLHTANSSSGDEDGYNSKTICDGTGRCSLIEAANNHEMGKYWIGNSIRSASDPDLEPGFPVAAISSAGTYGSGQGVHALVGNIDSDPKLEIIVSGFANGPLYAWHSDGSSVTGWPLTATYSAGYAAMGNISNALPGLEVVAGYFNSRLIAVSGTGNNLTGWPRNGAGIIDMPPTLADVDGDGLDEIFIGEDDRLLHAYKADGSSLPGWPVGGSGSQRRCTPAIADLDGDGDLEIITASGYVTGGYTLFAYHHDGTPVSGFPIVFGGYTRTFPAIGDVDGDGFPEIIVVGSGPDGVLVLSANGVIKRKLTPTGQTYYGSAPALADLDGDSIPEIIVQTNEALNVWQGNGSTFPGWPVVWGDHYWVGNSSPVVGDVDGDQQPDIVITLFDSYSLKDTGVRVYNRNGELHAHFPKLIDTNGGAVPAIADIDLDGHNEIVVTGDPWDYWKGTDYYDKVWVYDLGGGRHGQIEWGQFGGNPQHRGFYPPPPVINGVDLHIDVPSLIPVPPGDLAAVSLQYHNYGATRAMSVTLVSTVDSRLTYVSDTSGVVPEVSGTVITWTLPSVAYYNKNGFSIYFQVPLGAEYGTRYGITGNLTSIGPEVNSSDNSFSTEIMIARQLFLPTTFRQSR